MGQSAGAGAQDGEIEIVRHADWIRRFPWLWQGTTTARGTLRVHGVDRDPDDARRRWRQLVDQVGFGHAALSRQVHGTTVLIHDGPPGNSLDPRNGAAEPMDADGHVSGVPGLLLTVTVADCVPVFVVDPERRAVAVLHAGWRGAAAGILEEAVRLFAERGSPPRNLILHLGPAICGSCYEVGPEVHRSFGRTVPAPSPIDLHALLSERAVRLGVPTDQVSRARSCTLEDDRFYSHRGGDAGRHVGFIGVRP